MMKRRPSSTNVSPADPSTRSYKFNRKKLMSFTLNIPYSPSRAHVGVARANIGGESPTFEFQQGGFGLASATPT
jgi:hypothetical protein